MSKQAIFLFGQPGAGKGVQAELLAERFGSYHLESSKAIENCFKTESKDKVFTIDGQDFGVADEIAKWDRGELNSSPFVVALISERIKELAKDEKSIIFSGSIRTVYEAEKIIPLLQELYGKESIKVFFIEISAETTLFRNSHRRICELMRHSILFSEETEMLKLCPLDGSTLIKRKVLDEADTIKNRLRIYEEQTYPVVDYLQKEGIQLTKINGENSVAEVFGEISKTLA